MEFKKYFDTNRAVLQKISEPEFEQRGINLLVKRDDLIHPEVSGNKWRKLEYIVKSFYQSNKTTLLTFGGAYSNHLLATASACYLLQIPCVGVVRGEELSERSNCVLSRCHDLGMQLHFVSRSEYRLRYTPHYVERLSQRYENCYVVPEGGACMHGMIGCVKLAEELSFADHIFVAQGTSTTSCGLLWGATKSIIHAVPVIKNFDWQAEMKQILQTTAMSLHQIMLLFDSLKVHVHYHFGGYAKDTKELRNFIEECNDKYQLPLDRIYTAKAFYAAMYELKDRSYDNTTVVFVHTGGLTTQIFAEEKI